MRVLAVLALVLSSALGTILPASAHKATASPHVLIVMEENKGYAKTLGACSADPYLCSLAKAYASETDWWGVSHPSLPNYFAVTMGSVEGCTSDNCFKTLSGTSLGGQFTKAGIPWVAYMESMPTPCYTKAWFGGTGATAKYGEKHNPFVEPADVLNNGCAQHVLPYPGASGLLSTLNGANAPEFVWITPNQYDDMHTGSVQAGDAWLKANLAGVLTSSWFTSVPSTLIVTMDEGPGKAGCCGVKGGPIIEVVVSSNAKGVGNVSTPGDHYSTLRAIEKTFGLSMLGAASKASDILSLFG